MALFGNQELTSKKEVVQSSKLNMKTHRLPGIILHRVGLLPLLEVGVRAGDVEQKEEEGRGDEELHGACVAVGVLGKIRPERAWSVLFIDPEGEVPFTWTFWRSCLVGILKQLQRKIY